MNIKTAIGIFCFLFVFLGKNTITFGSSSKENTTKICPKKEVFFDFAGTPRRRQVTIKSGSKPSFAIQQRPECYDFDDLLELEFQNSLLMGQQTMTNVHFSLEIEDPAYSGVFTPVITNQFVINAITYGQSAFYTFQLPAGLTQGLKTFRIITYFSGSSSIDGYKVFINCCENNDIVHFNNYQLPNNGLPGFTGVADYVEAENSIVGSQQNVTFQAENFVVLSPGFSTQTGALFEAKIDSCPEIPVLFALPTRYIPPRTVHTLSGERPEGKNISNTTITVENKTRGVTDATLIVYPNPFSQQLTIDYRLEKAAMVSITIHNTLGQVVYLGLQDEYQAANDYQFTWNDNSLPSGSYFVILQIEGERMIKKVLKLQP